MLSFKALAASGLWFKRLSESSGPEISDCNFDVQLPESGSALDGFWEETNNGFAAGSICWSKALKFAHPDSFVSILAFGSKISLYVNMLSCLTFYKVTSKWMKLTKSNSSKFVSNVVFQLNFITKNTRSTIDILIV